MASCIRKKVVRFTLGTVSCCYLPSSGMMIFDNLIFDNSHASAIGAFDDCAVFMYNKIILKYQTYCADSFLLPCLISGNRKVISLIQKTCCNISTQWDRLEHRQEVWYRLIQTCYNMLRVVVIEKRELGSSKGSQSVGDCLDLCCW